MLSFRRRSWGSEAKHWLFYFFIPSQIGQKYGPVFTVHLGHRTVVVLTGYEAVKEALVDQAEEFSGRGKQATFDRLFKGFGVAFSNGERARQLRRFSITTLRDFGMGKRGIEERIQEEAGFLIEAFQGTKGEAIDPTFFLSRTVSNVISSIVFGDRFEYEDKQFLSLFMMLGQFTPPWALYEMFSPVMKHLPGPQQQAFKDLKGLEVFITEKVRQNQATLDPNSPRNFIDSFLIKMQEEKKNPNTEFFMRNLTMTTLNLFFAGYVHPFHPLLWPSPNSLPPLILFSHSLPTTAKIHEEIDRVIGRNRSPKFEDKAKMPYTEAVIHEIQRFGDMIPMGVARRVIKDTKFREVFPMLGSVLKDRNFFACPEAFNPQHFLDEKGQFKKSDAFVPFSIGKRYCFGESLARMELFLFLTTILQNFCFQSPVPKEAIDISPKAVGFATMPRSYTISFLPRE
uniref:Cytochrome P450 n=1 Tax=Sarcophilus harrisii TaxID=9305 RepID=A0A7N4PNH4_SARHA